MSELKNDAPRRYMVDGAGRHVLVGLSIEETIEFERLDSPTARRLHNGHVLWDGRDASTMRAEQRWRELYAKHERAWSEWMAESRGRSGRGRHHLNQMN